MDWFKGKFIGKPHIEWENLWFPVKIFPTKPILRSLRFHHPIPIFPTNRQHHSTTAHLDFRSSARAATFDAKMGTTTSAPI
jgi:hypothetical protein